MKKITGIFALTIFLLASVQTGFVSCTSGLDGDGVDSIYYPGPNLPENSNYRNPVWEPDFDLGTVFKGPSSYYGIPSETQWSAGITYCGSVLTSNNLMDWSFNKDRTAFPLTPDTVTLGSETTIYNRPKWAEGRIHSMTAGFARTLASYWLFYQIGETPAIGVAYGTSPQGPYLDFGKLLDADHTNTTSIKDPFFIVVGTRFYLFYSTEDGTYVQELTLRKKQMPAFRNAPVKVANANFRDVAVYSNDGNFYIFGTVNNGDKTQINYARAEAVTGPYADKDGKNLLDGNGALVIESGSQLINPENVCGIFADFYATSFILYNVTDASKPTLASGYNRRPLVMNKIAINEEGWIEGVVAPQSGWTAPKFRDKE